MKIEHTGPKPISKSTIENAYSVDKSARSSESSELSGISGKDKATLSEGARALAKAYAALDEAPEIRQERVAELRKQIESGNYEVPFEEVVKRLVKQVKI